MIDFVESINSKYIWNNEKFFLPNQPVRLDTPPTPNTDSLLSYYKCKGCIDYGDNLEDEWFDERFIIIIKLFFTFYNSISFYNLGSSFIYSLI